MLAAHDRGDTRLTGVLLHIVKDNDAALRHLQDVPDLERIRLSNPDYS